MSRNLALTLVVIVAVVAFGGWLLTRQQKVAPTPQPQVTPSPTSEVTSTPSATQEQKNVVKVESVGFMPKNITIQAGEKVSWVNNDTASHQVYSAVHPTHLLYPPLNTVGLLKAGESKSLIFKDPGTYKYHDHLNPSLTGQVTVE